MAPQHRADREARLDGQVTLRGEPVKLTPVEYKLLYHLVRNANQLMTHQAPLDRVWGGGLWRHGQPLEGVHRSRLRQD